MKHIFQVLFLLLLLLASPLSAAAEPAFSFTDLEGEIYTSAGLKGTPLVVNIGSHW